MDIPEVIFPGAQSDSQLQRRFDSDPEKKTAGATPARPKVPNIYVKKPHRKQPALGLFLAKADPADREDWRLTTGGSRQSVSLERVSRKVEQIQWKTNDRNLGRC